MRFNKQINNKSRNVYTIKHIGSDKLIISDIQAKWTDKLASVRMGEVYFSSLKQKELFIKSV